MKGRPTDRPINQPTDMRGHREVTLLTRERRASMKMSDAIFDIHTPYLKIKIHFFSKYIFHEKIAFFFINVRIQTQKVEYLR